jgi:hypothetical protein
VIFALAAAMSAAMAVAARPPAADRRLTVARFDSAVEAIRAALTSDPARPLSKLPVYGDSFLVVAFGEWHQTRATAAVPSALQRFSKQILPAFGDQFSHLIVETWVTTGRCGQVERAVTEDVERTTERPPQTENEIETLLRGATSFGIGPRILSMSCADYAAMRPEGQPVDYDRTLRLTTRALEEAVLSALRERRQRPPAGRSLVGIYGGALHNDVDPEPGLAAYSVAPRLLAATLGHVLEIDLVVPEYAARSAAVRAQPWWKAYTRARGSGKATLMIRRSARSFVIVFPVASKRDPRLHPSTHSSTP